MRVHHVVTIVGATAAFLAATTAEAHVSISSGPAVANKSQKILFSVGHGCEGADTIGIRVEIPADVTSVRALVGPFGKPSFEYTDEITTAVSWTKPLEDLQSEDVGYYELEIRARIADVPFSQIYFRVRQSCRTAEGVESTVDWYALPGEEGSPAANLVVLPASQPGWNKYVLAKGTAVSAEDLPTYFTNALIVWRGTSAYSANPHTATLIESTAGVTALTGGLEAAQEIWVRY